MRRTRNLRKAYAEGDVRLHFQLIRQLAPKTYRRTICLKSGTGGLLSSEQECILLTDYARGLFEDEQFDMPKLLPDPEWFAEEHWVWALSKIKARKAVPQNAAQIASWKQNSSLLAAPLAKIAINALSNENAQLPSGWSEVHLAWLPKPGQAPTGPEQLRTIGLMGADSKAFLMILKAKDVLWIQSALNSIPQYAYRSLASTSDPLLRGSRH